MNSINFTIRNYKQVSWFHESMKQLNFLEKAVNFSYRVTRDLNDIVQMLHLCISYFLYDECKTFTKKIVTSEFPKFWLKYDGNNEKKWE